MKSAKVLFLFLSGLLAPLLWAQEMSAEDAYLKDTEEIKIITELASSSSRAQKESAIEYINERISSGDATEEDVKILASLTMDGILNKSRANGRVINNFPDIRAVAVESLGKIKGKDLQKDAQRSLLAVCSLDNEPWVVGEAINSLVAIGIADEKDVALLTVCNTFYNYDAINPDNRLANSVIDFMENYNSSGLISTFAGKLRASEILRQISSNYVYIYQVRQRAEDVSKKLQKGSSSK
jgi:hypothetical protein